MKTFRPLMLGLVAFTVLGLSGQVAWAQGLEEARNELPVFSSGDEGQRAELYVYYPSVDYMVELEMTSEFGLFSDIEFGYLVGGVHSFVNDFLVSAWYGNLDEASMAAAVQQLEEEAKPMQKPFQQPGAKLAVAFDESGVGFTYSGQATEGGAEVSFSAKMTWAEVMAQ